MLLWRHACQSPLSESTGTPKAEPGAHGMGPLVIYSCGAVHTELGSSATAVRGADRRLPSFG